MEDVRENIVVRARGVTRRFGEWVAVERLDLDVRRGEIFGLVGPDGAGKTTTLRVLCGLVEPEAGEIEVAGCDVRRQREQVRDRIGYVAQRAGVYEDLSVEENMRFYADLYGVPAHLREARMMELLRLTRLEAFRRSRAHHLSGGMRQKLALACALVHRPQVLFLDEPTTGIDPISRRDVWALLAELRRAGVTIVFTTAYLDEAERAARIGLLYRGRLLRCASVEALRREFSGRACEVLTPDRTRAQQVLRRQEGVVSVEPFGATLRVIFDPARTSLDGIGHALQAEGLPEVEVRPLLPTLEDVFIALIRQHERIEEEHDRMGH
jgi:ABC-2 type transport system ATP-binding protein